MKRLLLAVLLAGVGASSVSAEDGYRLWLRYDRIENARPVSGVILATASGAESPTIAAARAELVEALSGLTGVVPSIAVGKNTDAVVGAGWTQVGGMFDARQLSVATSYDFIGVLVGVIARKE